MYLLPSETISNVYNFTKAYRTKVLNIIQLAKKITKSLKGKFELHKHVEILISSAPSVHVMLRIDFLLMVNKTILTNINFISK